MKTLALLFVIISLTDASFFNPCLGNIDCGSGGDCKIDVNPKTGTNCWCKPGYSGSFCRIKTQLTASTTSTTVGQTVTFTCSSIGNSAAGSYTFTLKRPAGGSTIANVVQASNVWTTSQPMNSAGTFTFDCQATKGGKGGSSNTVTVTVTGSDPCTGQTCNNRGTCSVVGGQAKCSCNAGFAGPTCQYKVTLSVSSASVALGGTTVFTCTTNIPLSTSYSYSLVRSSPGLSWPGTSASSSWSQSLVQNSAGTFTYTCTVSSGGITGNSNSVSVTVGSSKLCVEKDCNHGNCVVKNGQAVCVCDKGWMGAACNQVDVCTLITCLNGGTCNPTADACTCAKGFTGRWCQNVNVGAPCLTKKDCRGTPCGGSTREGYCKLPEFTCQCQDDPEPACKKHYECNVNCPKKVGLCMSNNKCNCFSSELQLIFFMSTYNYPTSPPFVAP